MSQVIILSHLDDAIAKRTLWNLHTRGITGLEPLIIPKRATQILRPKRFPDGHHRCVADHEEIFDDGIPVFKQVTVPYWGSNKNTCMMDTLKGEPYWSEPVLLLHEGRSPDREQWHPLGLVQATCLLGQYPYLGAVRFQMPSGTNWEVFISPDGRIYVWEGQTHREHHAAYTTQECPPSQWKWSN